MTHTNENNPLLAALFDSFEVKRKKRTGTVPPNWILALLCVLDAIAESPNPLTEDEMYTYDYTLIKSRSNAIVRLLEKHGFPTKTGLSGEGVTVRGAPCLRVFRAIKGGAVLAGRPDEEKKALIKEAIELLRSELLLTIG